MLVTDRFVFIHLHRTGGNFLAELIERHFSNIREIGYHRPRANLPLEFAHLPAFGFVRAPHDWYASWYRFNAGRTHNHLYPTVSGGGRYDRERTLRNLLHLGSAKEPYVSLRRELIEKLPETMENNRALGLTKTCLRTFESENEGYFTWLMKRMFCVRGSFEDMYLGKHETLYEDTQLFLRRAGAWEDSMAATWAELGIINSSREPEAESSELSADLRAEIDRQDRFIYDRFGYRPSAAGAER